MLRRASLTAKRADSRNIRAEPNLLGAVRPRRQLNQRVQRHFHPRTLFLGNIHVVRIYAAQHRLVRHDDDILAAFEFHDDGFEADDDVAVGFAASVTVVVLVVITGAEVFGVAVGYFLVGERVTDARVELVEGFPFEFGVALWGGGEVPGCLDGSFES